MSNFRKKQVANMKTWYLTREPNLVHRGCVVSSGAKIYLTPDQAKLHEGKIVKTEPPDNKQDAFVLEDYSEYISKKIQETKLTLTEETPKEVKQTFEGAP